MKLMVTEQLKSGMVTARDVFPPNNTLVPYIRKGTRLTAAMLEEMVRLNIHFAYVDAPSDPPAPTQPVADFPFPEKKPSLPPQLQKDALLSLENAFSAAELVAPEDIHASSVQVIRQVDAVVGRLVDSLNSEKDIMVNITDLKSYDEYTYHHSLSVAVLSIAIGQYLGLGDAGLNQIGMAAMMHDIGKTAVPIEVIHKTSRLDEAEFNIVKNHSPAGYDYLLHTAIEDDELCEAVLFHHEKVDGTGYPQGIAGDDIPVLSKIISVADVYDALTSNRPYRIPMQPAEAIEYLMGSVGSAFDLDVVDAFIHKVELYPVGSRVLLSNSRAAVVLRNENPMRPVVQLLDSGEILDLYRDRSCLSIVVSKLLPSV